MARRAVAATTVRVIGCCLPGLFGPEGVSVVGDPLGVAARGATEDSFHFAGDGCDVRDLPGVSGHQGRHERPGEAIRDHTPLEYLGLNLLEAQRPADHLAD